jgi:hypothetical protein
VLEIYNALELPFLDFAKALARYEAGAGLGLE